MPPLAKARVHTDAMEVLAAWIARVSPQHPRSGITYEYFETGQLEVLPDFDALTPDATGMAQAFDLSSRERDDNFAFRFSGFVTVPFDGDWTFYTSSDDGSQLFIDGELVVDNDGLHGTLEESGIVELTAGIHAIVVTFFERGGAEVLNVAWEHASAPKRAITGLLVEEPTPIENEAPVMLVVDDQEWTQGSEISLSLTATDADDDDLYFTVNGLPQGVEVDAESGEIAGVPETPGTYSVIAGVSDGPTAAWVEFSILVEEAETTATGGAGGDPGLGGASSGGDDGSDGGAGMGDGGETSSGGLGGSTGGTSSEDPTEDDDSGCGCRVAGGEGRNQPLGLLLGLVFSWAAYVRRFRSRPSIL
jgi:hypothetical protein